MATTTRWLKWNGVYTHAGVCNQKFAPVEEDLGVKERLMALGFNCSSPDKFESAIKMDWYDFARHNPISRITG